MNSNSNCNADISHNVIHTNALFYLEILLEEDLTSVELVKLLVLGHGIVGPI